MKTHVLEFLLNEKETPTQALSCEYCEIVKDIFFIGSSHATLIAGVCDPS